MLRRRLAYFGFLLVLALAAPGRSSDAQPQLPPLVGAAPATGNQDCCDPGISPCRPAEYDGIHVALIIGNDKYGGALKPLANAANDARALAGMIGDNYKFRCVLNADKRNFNAEIDAFRMYLEKTAKQHQAEWIDGRALLYFSGHGFSVNNENYVALSGTVNNKQDLLDNHAKLVSSVAFRIGGHTNFKTYLIFDSCRNFVQGQVDKPDWVDGGFVHSSDFFGQNLIFSTGTQNFAHDEFDENNHTNNGAYAHTVKKYSVFKGLTSGQLFVKNVGDDPAMRHLNQIPSGSPGEYWDPISWTGTLSDSNSCPMTEANIVNAIGSCQSTGNPVQCMQGMHVCTDLSVISRSTSQSCTTQNLRGIFASELAICLPSDPGTPVADLLGAVSVQGLVAEAAANSDPVTAASTLQLQAQSKVLASLWQSTLTGPLAAASRLQARPGKLTASRAQSQQIQRDINRVLQSSTDIHFAADEFRTSPTITAQGGMLDLKLAPSSYSGSTGRHTITGPVVVDCSRLPCTDDFVMAQVPTDEGPLKAWVETSKLTPERPKCAASLRYDGSTNIPAPTALAALEMLMAPSCIDATSVIVIVAAVPDDGSEATALQANERVAFVRNILFRPIINPTNIKTIFPRTNNTGTAAPVTVQVFAR